MNNDLNRKIITLADDFYETAVNLRRNLHQIPEVAWQEEKTAARLSEFLKKHKIQHKKVTGTGILATIKSGEGKCVAIRTDIDALPIYEENDFAYKSQHQGRMHACGHDMHMATISTAAVLLDKLKDFYSGTVKIIYQPAEEEPPGGAIEMIKQGVMNSPKVDMIFGMHVNTEFNKGEIAIRDGALMAGVLDFDIIVTGKGGHGALPHNTNDSILTAAKITENLQQIVSRNINPFEPAVVTIGKIDGGTARNIIPMSCKLYGTARALNQKTLGLLKQRINKITKSIAIASNCQAEIKYHNGYPPLVNSKSANKFILSAAKDLFCSKSIHILEDPYMGGEDFARYLEHSPGAMFFLGVRNKEIDAVYNWHHPKFKADEEAIKIGAMVLVRSVIDFLRC